MTVSLDLYRRSPSIRRRSASFDDSQTPAMRAARSVTLDPALPPAGQIARRFDPARIASLLSAIVTQVDGRPLSAIVPVAGGLPLIVGINGANVDFDEYLDFLLSPVVEGQGRVVTAPAARSEDPLPSAMGTRTCRRARSNTEIEADVVAGLVARFAATGEVDEHLATKLRIIETNLRHATNVKAARQAASAAASLALGCWKAVNELGVRPAAQRTRKAHRLFEIADNHYVIAPGEEERLARERREKNKSRFTRVG